MRMPIAFTLLWCSVVAQFGCVTVEDNWVQTMGPASRPSSDIQFSDIPVPRDMTIRANLNQSYSYEVGSYRYAHFVYEGGVEAPTLAEFLQNRMPMHGWKLEAEDKGPRDEIRLRFRHLDQVAECEVKRLGLGSQLVVDVTTRRQG
jgi:hypothetical protein